MRHRQLRNLTIEVLGLTFGPSSLARFSAEAHGEYNPDADDVGEEYFVQSQAERYVAMNYTLSDSFHFAWRDARDVRPRRDALNHEFYYNRELNRIDSEIEYVLRWDERDKEFHLFNEEFQEFLPDMIHNWERYLQEEKKQPELFNKAEAESILEMDRLLAAGEVTSAFYAVSEPFVADSIRYVNQFVFENGKVTAQYLDVGKFVRDLKPEEAFDVIKTLGEKFGFQVAGEGHGYTYLVSNDIVLTSRQIHDAVLQKLVEQDGISAVEKGVSRWEVRQKDHWDSVDKRSIALDTLYTATQTLGETGVRVARDIRDTVAPIGTLLAAEFYHRRKKKEEEALQTKESNKSKEKKPSLVDRLKQLFSKESIKESHKEKLSKKKVSTEESSVVLFEQKSKIHLQEKEKKSQERARRFRRIGFAARLAPVAGEFGIALPLLAVLAKSEKQERRGVAKRKRRQMLTPQEFVLGHKTRKNKESSRKKRKPVREGRILFANRSDFPSRTNENLWERRRRKAGKRLSPRSPELFSWKEKVKRKSDEKRISQKRKERYLASMVVLLIQKFQSERSYKQTKEEKKDVAVKRNKQKLNEMSFRVVPIEARQRTREQVVSFSLVFALWLLLRRQEPKDEVSKLGRNKENSHILIYEKNKQQGNDLVQLEAAPWILLAIIWYLAMIREQGMAKYISPKNTPSKQTKKKKNKKIYQSVPIQWLPPQGVIFAAAS